MTKIARDTSNDHHFRQLLPSSEALLREMYSADALPGASTGTLVKIDRHTRISESQGAELHRLVLTNSARATLEVGFAYGFSTAWILDAISRMADAAHVAIDPYQLDQWGGVGLETVNRSKCADRFQWIQERSDFAIASLAKESKTFDFIYIDGNHRFDDVLVDFYLADRVLNVQGLLVFDDMWMPSIRSVVSFVERNRSYERVFSAVTNISVFRKLQSDGRDWRHFVPFNGSPKADTRFHRLVGRLKRIFG